MMSLRTSTPTAGKSLGARSPRLSPVAACISTAILLVVALLQLLPGWLGYLPTATAQALDSGNETTSLAALPSQPLVRRYYRHTSVFGEPERRLSITTPEAELHIRLMDGWGPRMRTSLYQIDDSHLAVIDAAGASIRIALQPLRILRHSEPPTAQADQWTYVGAFDQYDQPHPSRAGGRTTTSGFIPAVRQAECIPTYFEDDVGRGDRAPFKQRRCPVLWLGDDSSRP